MDTAETSEQFFKRTNKECLTVAQLIYGLEEFRSKFGGDLPVRAPDNVPIGDLEFDESIGVCRLMFRDMSDRVSIRPFAFEIKNGD